ncbi:MAG TPA: serine/threonine-protein kinase, partial [Candidatus Nanopelagicales bacterium]|nr:serine/threonine-protein kinase [Candidatus Nanopelagicales bacterium]
MTTGSPRPDFAGTARFEVVREIGLGGAGVVYEVFDRERSGRVALKVLRALDAEGRLRFKTEFRSLQDLHHPNLVSLGELHEQDGQLFLTMELVRGVDFVVYVREHEQGDVEPPSSLRSVDGAGPPPLTPEPEPERTSRRRPSFDEARLRGALAQLLQGLCALHDARKVHRDIKPSNVLVTAGGRVVILDFGLITDSDAPRRHDQAEGTAHFIAPEQADGLPVGPAADMYSVGVMLYLALTGEYPFRGSPSMALRLKRWVAPPPPGEITPGLPPDLEQLCVELLRIDPAARPSAREMLRRLHVAPLEDDLPEISLRQAFVGREQELAELTQAFAEARAGRATAELVEGESGVGKSALLRRFLVRIAGEALVLTGRCHERESVPYKALDGLIDALSLHLAALPARDAQALLPPDAAL